MSCKKGEAGAEIDAVQRRALAHGSSPATPVFLSANLGWVDRNAGRLIHAGKVLQHVGAFCLDRVVALVPHSLEKTAK